GLGGARACAERDRPPRVGAGRPAPAGGGGPPRAAVRGPEGGGRAAGGGDDGVHAPADGVGPDRHPVLDGARAQRLLVERALELQLLDRGRVAFARDRAVRQRALEIEVVGRILGAARTLALLGLERAGRRRGRGARPRGGGGDGQGGGWAPAPAGGRRGPPGPGRGGGGRARLWG